MANWTAKVAAAFHAIAGGLGLQKKVKSTSFDERNGKAPFNASGVAKVGPGRFVFIATTTPQPCSNWHSAPMAKRSNGFRGAQRPGWQRVS